jgi:hypothetical protein
MNRISLFALLLGMLFVLPSCQKETADPNKPTEAQLEESQAEIDKIIHMLQAPQESYLLTRQACREIGTIRRQSFQESGIEWICPWDGPTRLVVNKSPNTSKAEPLPVGSLPNEAKLHRAYFRRAMDEEAGLTPELIWNNRSRRGCLTLTSLLRGAEPRHIAHRALLKPNSTLWTDRIRPLLLLLSQSPQFGIAACDALVAGGERSEYLKQRLIHFLRERTRDDDDCDDIAKLMTECGWEVPPKYPKLWKVAVLQVKPAMQKRLTTREDKDFMSPMARIVSVENQGRRIEFRVRGGRDKPVKYVQYDLVDKSVTQVKNTISRHNRLRVTGPSDELVAIEYVSDGKTDRRGEKQYNAFLVLREPKTRTVRWRTRLISAYLSSLQISPDGKRIVAIDKAGRTSKLLVYDASNGQLLFRQVAPGISPVHFVPSRVHGTDAEGRVPAMVTLGPSPRGSLHRMLIGWDSEMLPWVFNPLISNCAVAVTPDGKRAVTISDHHFLHWYLRRGDYLDLLPRVERYRTNAVLPRDAPDFLGFGFTPDGKYLSAGLKQSTTIAFWTPKGQCVGRLSLAKGEKLNQVRWVGNRLLALSYDGELTVWNWRDIAAAIQKQKAQP